MNPAKKNKLSHVDERGRIRMVDVSEKDVTVRTAVASACVSMDASVLGRVMAADVDKGEPLVAAKIAGVAAAKRTADLIPLCHPLALDWVDVQCVRQSEGTLRIEATARTSARTGVEMEAMVAASVAALTIYDMVKAVDKAITIGPIQLESKSGGKSGAFCRATPSGDL